jgi:glycine cleavage system H lipoate-binding protein
MSSCRTLVRYAHGARGGGIGQGCLDLFSPVTGAVNQVNEELFNRPELVNSDPYGQGWMLMVEMSDLSQLDSLMTAEQYEAYLRQAKEG